MNFRNDQHSSAPTMPFVDLRHRVLVLSDECAFARPRDVFAKAAGNVWR